MDPRGSILLVDDEEKILRALARALRDAGHEVVTTTSAAPASDSPTRAVFTISIMRRFLRSSAMSAPVSNVKSAINV